MKCVWNVNHIFAHLLNVCKLLMYSPVGRAVVIWADWSVCWHNNVDIIRNLESFPALYRQTWPSSYPGWFDPLSGVYRDITSLAVDDAGHT